MDTCARDFVKFISAQKSTSTTLKKADKNKASAFSEKLVSGKNWEPKIDKIWEQIIQSKRALNSDLIDNQGQVPSK